MSSKILKEDNLKSLLQNQKPFLNISKELLNYFVEHSVIKSIQKGTYLWKKDDPGDFAAVIVSGYIEISYPTQSGEERLIGVFGPNDVIGLSAVLKKSSFPANAKSCCGSTNVLKLFIKAPEANISKELLIELRNWERELLLHHEQVLREKIHFTGAGKVHLKLIELFQHLINRFGIQTRTSKHNIPVSLTKTQLAQLIDNRVETVIRILNRWQKMGYLKMSADSITILNFEGMKSSKETGKSKKTNKI